MSRSKEMDLTTGNPFQSLLKFAIPVILGNLFQEKHLVQKHWLLSVPPVSSFTLFSVLSTDLQADLESVLVRDVVPRMKKVCEKVLPHLLSSASFLL